MIPALPGCLPIPAPFTSDGMDRTATFITPISNPGCATSSSFVASTSVFRHQGAPDAATLHLPQALYVYDLKARKDYGRQQAVSLTVTPYRALFYALSPQPLQAVELKTAPEVASGSVQQVTVTSTLPEGRQAVKLQVKLPDGAVADWVDRVVVVDQQGAVVDVPVAFNDPQGSWTVSATELYTGTAATVQFTVK